MGFIIFGIIIGMIAGVFCRVAGLKYKKKEKTFKYGKIGFLHRHRSM